MFPRTLKDLTIRPGEVARQFITGNRVLYYGPVGYFFLMLGLYLLIASIINVDLPSFLRDSNAMAQSMQDTPGQEAVYRMLTGVMSDNFRTVTFINTLFTIFFTHLFFRRSGYNFVETSTLVFFLSGHIIWLSVISLFTYKLFGYPISAAAALVFHVVYSVFAYANFYTYQSRVRVVMKGMLVMLVSTLSLMLLSMIGMIIYVSNNPEVMKLLKGK